MFFHSDKHVWKWNLPTIATVFFITLLALPGPSSLMASGAIEEPHGGTTELVILHTNDLHGHPVKFYNYPAPNVGGLPAIATLASETRRKHENVLILDAGDINTGRPESNFYNAAPDIIGMNYIGYDAASFGNHEFDKELTILADQQRLAHFPLLSANITYSDGTPFSTPYIIKKFGNLRVGIFGLTTTETPTVTSPSITKDLVFMDEVEASKLVVAELEPQTDIIIAVGHLGLYDNNKIGSRRVVANVEGIDLFIDGHSQTRISEPFIENGTPIVQSWQWGLEVGKGILTVQDGKVTNFDWQAMPINLKNREKDADGNSIYSFVGEEIKEDSYLLNTLTPYVEQVDQILSQVIGNSAAAYQNDTVRLESTALGHLVADAMLWATKDLGVDFAIQNSGGIRASLPPGPIAMKNIYEILPFDNSVVTVEMSGQEVRRMFDLLPGIPRGKGGFPQVSAGVSFTLDFNSGETTDVLINGQPIDDNRKYKVATNSFMADGGDGYTMLKSGYLYDTSAFQRDVIIDYIKSMNKAIKPDTEKRFKVIEAK